MIGGAGDDVLAGDYTWVASSFAWTVTTLANRVRKFKVINGGSGMVFAQPTVGAADVIYGEGAASDIGGSARWRCTAANDAQYEYERRTA